MHLKQELETRGFLHQYTHESIFDLFDKWWQSFYFWVDCSSNSMTIWNFVALQMAIHFMLKWNKCYLLVGWATSIIWNPSWKDKERPTQTPDQLLTNQLWIAKQFYILTRNIQKVTWKKLDYEIVNNYDFFKDMNVLDFLKEVWKFMTINWMMNKEIVKKRITDPDKFISYAEFSYMLIMWYDFYYLNKNKNVILEVGWSDEWDWILSWIELIAKKSGKEAYWVTNKLITDSNWKKFWKSEWNAVWLDPEKNSPYFVYQFFMNTTDSDIERFLKLFTFLDFSEIENILLKHNERPELHYWQEQLAKYVVSMIFWLEKSLQAEKITKILFSDKDRMEIINWLNNDERLSLKMETWWINFDSSKNGICDILTLTWICDSNWEAKKLIKSNSIFINENKVEDIQKIITEKDFINNVLLIRRWKKTFKTILIS